MMVPSHCLQLGVQIPFITSHTRQMRRQRGTIRCDGHVPNMATLTGIVKNVHSACGWVRGDVIEWCRGRNWLIRAPVWLLLAYFGVRQAINPQAWTLFSGINLPIHEGGHLLFRLLGCEFLHVAGGTLLQMFAPLASAVMFFKHR